MLRGEAQILWQLLRGQAKHGTHKEKLENFYSPQAAHYDRFREKLLPGRDRMLEALALRPGQHVVELGGGTARNLDFLEPEIRASMAKIDVIDLCPALVNQARKRCESWHNVAVIEDDATQFDPGVKVDRVYLSYALTMIPDWQSALRNAYRMLKPGGMLGIVDFHVRNGKNLSALDRSTDRFWRSWFGHDGVMLDAAHLPYVTGLFETHHKEERKSRVPYVPIFSVPYYIFVGRK